MRVAASNRSTDTAGVSKSSFAYGTRAGVERARSVECSGLEGGICRASMTTNLGKIRGLTFYETLVVDRE